jgi:predicted transcriptional regulator
MQTSEALATKIDARIAELKSEIAAHERALVALRGRKAAGATSAPAANGRRAASGRAAANGRRAAAQQDGRASAQGHRARRPRTASAEAVFDALNEGQDQASAIATQFGVSAAVVRSRLAQLEEAGRVSRTGNRRSTKWRSHAG